MADRERAKRLARAAEFDFGVHLVSECDLGGRRAPHARIAPSLTRVPLSRCVVKRHIHARVVSQWLKEFCAETRMQEFCCQLFRNRPLQKGWLVLVRVPTGSLEGAVDL